MEDEYGFDAELFEGIGTELSTEKENEEPAEEVVAETETEAEAEEVQEVEEPVEEPEQTLEEEEVTEETVKETVKETVEEVVEEPEEEMVSISKAEFDELRKTLDELSAKVLETPTTSAKLNEAAASAGTSGTEEVDFLGDLDIDEVASEPTLMNQLLNTVLRTAQETISQAIVSALPQLVQPTIRQTMAMDTAINKFYETHSLLGNFRGVVGQVANKIQAANPEESLDNLLPKIAEESYKVLKINPKAAPKPVRQLTSKTGLPRATGSVRPSESTTSDLSDQEQQILDLLG